jgi:type VI protein secretion system component Hcp
MSNSLAEAYLLIVRESNVPIIGEAVPVPFTGQIELDAWTWDLKNAVQLTRTRKQTRLDGERREEKKKKEKEDAKAKAGKDAKTKTPTINPADLIKKVEAIQSGKTFRGSQLQRDEEVRKLLKKAVTEYNDAAEQANEEKEKDDPTRDEDPEDRKLKFTFEKGTDLATTPLLFALARGDLIPKAVLTLFHRAKSVPVTLVITMSDVRLTNYRVSCEAESAMSEVKETWEATYQSIDWMYQNRPAASGPNLVTQGTVRVFSKGSKLSKLPV